MTNELGGPDSADKRDWLAGAVSELIPAFPAAPPASAAANTSSRDDDIDNAYIQEFLQGVMEDEFEVIVEEGDPSLWKVAEQIVRMRRDCAVGDFKHVESMRERWGENRGKKVEYRREEVDQETDGSDSEDIEGDADVDMDDVAPTLVKKPEPEVDEDGFTKVTRKKK